MNKKLTLFLLMGFVAMTGCNQQTELPNEPYSTEQNTASDSEQNVSGNISSISLSELNEHASEQVSEVRSKEYENLTFSDSFSVVLPDAAPLYELNLIPKTEATAEECFALFDTLFEASYGEVYEEHDKEKLYHFISTDIPATNQEYPENYPLFSDYKEELLSGQIDFSQLFIDTPEGYLAVNSNGVVHALNCGKTAKIEGMEAIIGMYFPANDNEIICQYSDVGSQDAYPLLDQEVTIAQAVEDTKKLITEAGFGGGTNLQASVSQVKAVELQENICGYSMTLTSSYHGVPFDVYYMETDGIFTSSEFSDSKIYNLMPGNAFMLESGKLDIVVGYNSAYDVTVTNTYEEVISLSHAVQLFSESFSEHMNMNVKSAQLMYTMYYTSSDQDELQSDIVWKFISENTNDALTYVVYINAINGACSYYIY